MNFLKVSALAAFVLLGCLNESEARTGRSSGGGGGSLTSSRSRRPSGADPNDPRYRRTKYNVFGDNDSDSDDDDKPKKKKKKGFF